MFVLLSGRVSIGAHFQVKTATLCHTVWYIGLSGVSVGIIIDTTDLSVDDYTSIYILLVKGYLYLTLATVM